MTAATIEADVTASSGDIDLYFELAGYQPDEIIGICWNPRLDSTDLHYSHVKVTDAAAEIARHDGLNCWVNAAVFKRRPEKRGKAIDMGRLPAFYADLDFKCFSTLPEAEAIDDLEAIDKVNNVIFTLSELLGEQPTVVVGTVGGAHPRWRADRDIDDATLSRFGKLVKQVAESNGGTADSVFDRSRLLRAPGSVNSGWKRGAKVYSEPRPTDVIPIEGGDTIDLDRVIDLLDARGIQLKRETERPQAPTTPLAPGRGNRYTESAVKRIVEDLGASATWPENHKDMSTGTGRGWEKFQADCAYRLASLALASWNDLTLAQAQQAFLAAAPTDSGWTFDQVSTKWDYQQGYAKAATPPPDLDIEISDPLDLIGGIGHSPNGNGHAAPESDPEPEQPTVQGLWDRPVMKHIFDFARARGVAPYSLLASVMARSMAMLPPSYVLPPLVGGVGSLNMFFALVGSSGAGKGTSNSAAKDCFEYVQSRPDGAHERPWSDPLDEAEVIDWSSGMPMGPPLPLHVGDVGSGEGLMHVYSRYETKGESKGKIVQYRACAMLNVHEVDSLTALGGRQGSTLMPMLREVWSGETLAPQFVDKEKRLHLEEQSYRCTMIVGVQPGRSGTLLDDSEGGTPQRFVWLPTDDPGALDELLDEPARRKLRIPSPTAGQHRILLADEVRTEIRKARVARLRGETNGEDGHRHFAQEKVAASLALLDGHLIEQGITVDDWQLARALMSLSDSVVKHVKEERSQKRAEANRARAEFEAERELVKTGKVGAAAVDKCREAVLNKLDKLPPEEWMSASEIRRGVRVSHREVLPEVLDLMVAKGLLESAKVTHNTQSGLKYRARR